MRWLILLLLGGLSACSAVPPPATEPEKPLREELLRRIPEKEPDWAILGSREEDEEHYYFVGYSGKHREERDALGEARREAGNRFVEYCGIETRLFNEFLSVSYGLSSEARDATESGRAGSKQRAEAYFSRLKLVERSAEVFREIRGDAEVGRFYRIKVLARVPKTEYERVQQWKKEQQQQRIRIAEDVLEKLLSSAQRLAAQGDLLSSLEKLRQTRKSAKEEQTPRWKVYLARSDEQQSALLSGLNLFPASKTEQQIEPGDPPEPLMVHVELRGVKGEKNPVQNFPVLFFNPNSRISIRSGADGNAIFRIPPKNEEGTLEVLARTEVELLEEQMPEETLAALKNRTIPFRIEVLIPFLKQSLKPDFQLLLSSSVDPGSLKVNQAVAFSVECEKRCRARLYVWDGARGILLSDTGSRRLLRNKAKTLVELTPDAGGKFTFIALASLKGFPDSAAPGTEYYPDEFRVVLKNFRAIKEPKSETQLEINVSP